MLGWQLSESPPTCLASCSAGQEAALTPQPSPLSSRVNRGCITDPFLLPPLSSVRHPYRLSLPMCHAYTSTSCHIPINTQLPHMLSVVTHTQSSWPQQCLLIHTHMHTGCHVLPFPHCLTHTLLVSPSPNHTGLIIYLQESLIPPSVSETQTPQGPSASPPVPVTQAATSTPPRNSPSPLPHLPHAHVRPASFRPHAYSLSRT